MPRLLLNSEIAILQDAGASRGGKKNDLQQVRREYYSPPRQSCEQWFNTDFVVELDNWDQTQRPKAKCVPIRPKSPGAEFFVMLTPDGVATKLELLSGESIARSSFSQEIQQIDQVLHSFSGSPQEISTDNAPFLRIARLKNSIAFLICSTTDILHLLAAHPISINSGRHLIAYRELKGETLIDGVIND